MVKISSKCKASVFKFDEVALENVAERLRLRNDCYEVLNDTVNRCYLDFDGKFENIPITEEEFNQINIETQNVIESYLGDDTYVLGTSSSFDYRKISFRVIYPNVVMTPKKNKKFAKELSKTLKLPQHVGVDLLPYMKNQKIRMFYSSKDGENRPMIPIGDINILDTLLSHIPTDASMVKDDDPIHIEDEYIAKESNSIISSILKHLNTSRVDDYDQWVKIGMICKTEKEPIDTWETASRRSSKYKRGECESKWKTFKSDGGIGLDLLWNWLEEDDPDMYQELKQHDYKFQKIEFEKEIFCLNTPPCFIRLTYDKNGIQKITPIKIHDLQHIFSHRLDFISKWTKDPERLVYERMDLLPRMEVPVGVFNTFRGFAIDFEELQSPTCETIIHLVENLCNYDKNVTNYVLDWFAHLIQKPYEKPGTCLIFKGEQGAGKDTVIDGIIGRILGEEYHKSTSDAMHDVFGAFNAEHRKTIFLNLQEANFMTNKAKADVLKGMITSPTCQIRDKGIKTETIRSCLRIAMTTNADSTPPVLLEDSNRRFVLIESSNRYCSNSEFWTRVHKTIPLELRAFYELLNTRDISNFMPMKFPITEYHSEVKQFFTPVMAKIFQSVIQSNHEQHVFEYTANELLVLMNGTKYEMSAIQLGKQLKKYIREQDEDKSKPILKKRLTVGFKYKFFQTEMVEFLKTNKWWVDI